MVRLIILVLIIIGGIWMFRACENDTEKVEFTEKEQTNERSEKKEKQSAREAKESREEKVSKTESKKEDDKKGESTTLAGKEEGKKDSKKDQEKGDDKASADSDKKDGEKSWSEKLMDKIKGGADTEGTAKVEAGSNSEGSSTPGDEATYGNLNAGTSAGGSDVAAQVVVPDRDSRLRVYVYENAVDTFGKPPTTGRVHLEVTNTGEWSQKVSILNHADLGKVKSGDTAVFVVEFTEAGTYYIQSHSAMGGAEREMPVVE